MHVCCFARLDGSSFPHGGSTAWIPLFTIIAYVLAINASYGCFLVFVTVPTDGSWDEIPGLDPKSTIGFGLFSYESPVIISDSGDSFPTYSGSGYSCTPWGTAANDILDGVWQMARAFGKPLAGVMRIVLYATEYSSLLNLGNYQVLLVTSAFLLAWFFRSPWWYVAVMMINVSPAYVITFVNISVRPHLSVHVYFKSRFENSVRVVAPWLCCRIIDVCCLCLRRLQYVRMRIWSWRRIGDWIIDPCLHFSNLHAPRSSLQWWFHPWCWILWRRRSCSWGTIHCHCWDYCKFFLFCSALMIYLCIQLGIPQISLLFRPRRLTQMAQRRPSQPLSIQTGVKR